MRKIFVIALVPILILIACGKKAPTDNQSAVIDFHDCVKAGHKVLESYPRQCQTPDRQVFVEQLTDAEKDKIKTGLPNPASVFCIEQGGSIEIKTNDQGSVGLCKFEDGSECEEWAFYRGQCAPSKVAKQTGEEESMQVAKTWILTQSPTYTFDGSGLLYERTQELDCPDCYQFIFSFESSQAGFGDRSDLMSAQVITRHIIVINVEKGRVVSAVTDNQYDEIKDKAS